MHNWFYEGRDPSLLLFDQCLTAWNMPIKGRVAELGCCETDFLERMAEVAARPGSAVRAIVGIDQRERPYRGLPTAHAIQGDVLDPSLQLPAFDWLVSL